MVTNIDHPSILIEPGSLVFDIGANTGYMTELWKHAGAGTIVCVEPCWRNFYELLKRPGIVPIHAAAWSSPSIIPISYCSNQSGLSTHDPSRWGRLFPGAKYDPEEYVPCVTLNQLATVFGIPHFVKVDVEGSELDVVSSMTFKPKFLIFEYQRDYLVESIKILEYIRKLGFTKVAHLDGELNIDLEPIHPIDQFIDLWSHGRHHLGNITAT